MSVLKSESAEISQEAAPASTEEPVVSEETQQPQEDAGGEEPSGGNPAWQEILDIIPAPFHTQLRPKLESWDKGVQDRFQKFHEQYDPYKQFVEQSVDPRVIGQGLGLVQRFNQDPAKFYEDMGSMLRERGLLKEAAKAEQAAEELEETEEQGQAEFKDPRFDTLLEQVRQAQAQQQEQQQVAAAERQIDQEFVTLEQRVGSLDENTKRQIIRQAQAMYDEATKAGTPLPSISTAYDSLMSFARTAIRTPAAPQVLPGGGGQPAPQGISHATLAKDDKARRAAAAEVIRRHQNR